MPKLEDLPVVEIAKASSVKQDAYALSEHELTALIQKHADSSSPAGREFGAGLQPHRHAPAMTKALRCARRSTVTKNAGWLGSVTLSADLRRRRRRNSRQQSDGRASNNSGRWPNGCAPACRDMTRGSKLSPGLYRTRRSRRWLRASAREQASA